MNISVTAVLIAILTMSAGCASTGSLSSEMAGWQGEDVGIAIAAWGEPEAERAFGDETILIWRDRPAVVSAPGAVVCERMLAIAEDSTITGWRWRGDACESIGAADRQAQMAASR